MVEKEKQTLFCRKKQDTNCVRMGGKRRRKCEKRKSLTKKQ